MNISSSLIKKGLLNPRTALRYVFNESHRNAATYLAGQFGIGTNIFKLDWDVLVLLDTCRVDALKSMTDRYEFVSNINSIFSVGGQSGEWMINTFNEDCEDSISDTAYISANPHTESVIVDRMDQNSPHYDKQLRRLSHWGRSDYVNQSAFGLFEQTWKYRSDDDEDIFDLSYEHSPPRYVTDRGISIARNYDFNRIILHYMIPHAPYISTAIKQKRDLEETEQNPFKCIQEGYPRSDIYDLYLSDLKYILDEVELLRDNIDCNKLVVSSDHGEAFGELGVYMHHVGSLHPHVRRVPWMVTSAKDKRTHNPKIDYSGIGERQAKEALEALGYL